MSQAPNVASILNWTRNNRPDLEAQIKQAIEEPAFMLLLSIGHEAGRAFQGANPELDPTAPVSPFDTYKQAQF